MPTEEERRRKIIIDSQVAAIANRGILAAALNQLSAEMLRELMRCDEEYIRAVRGCAPDLVASALGE